MTDQNTLLLDESMIRKKIRRIAFEIYEQNFDEEHIVFAGIEVMGYRLAELLQEQLEDISPLKTKVLKVTLDKKSPLQSDVEVSTDPKIVVKQVVIIVDDVFNTGRTLAYSFKPFLNVRVKKLQVAVLVDRGHHSFPVHPNYVGYALSTTIKDHVEVSLEEGKPFAAHLS